MTKAKDFSRQLAHHAESAWGAFLLCAIFTLLMMYNYIFPLGALLYTSSLGIQDCGQMVWNLWHVNEAITSGHNPYFTDSIFYPLKANLTHHTMAAGFFPVTFLVQKLSGNGMMYPFYAYRIITWFSFTLILYGSYFALREIGASRLAAIAASIGYAFCDFYVLHVLHLNHLGGFFIPLTALCLVRCYKRPTMPRLLAFALVSSCAIYFTEFAIYIYMAALFFAVAIFLLPEERASLVEQIKRAGFKRILLAMFVFSLIATPFLTLSLMDNVLKPAIIESSTYSANLAGFFIPDAAQTPLYGNLFSKFAARITTGISGYEVFIGFPLLIFAIVGLIKVPHWLLRVSFVVALVFFALSLGPTLKVFGADTNLKLPYALLARVPPFDLGRTPVRFVVMAMFLLATIAAHGMTWMQKSLEEHWGGRASLAAMLLLCALTTAEAYSPIARQSSFGFPRELTSVVDGPVLNLPISLNDGRAAMLQIFHRQPISTGYLARYTADERARFEQLSEIYNHGGAQFCERIAALGFKNILISPDAIGADLIPLELSSCRLNIIDLREKRSAANDALAAPVFSDGAEFAEFPAYNFGTRIDLTKKDADKYLWYGWSGPEPDLRWTSRWSAAIIFSLDKPATSVLRIKLGAFIVPGKLEQQRVVVKLNNQDLTTLTLTNAEPKEYEIVLPENSLQEKNVLRFELPDAGTPRALTGSDDGRSLAINARWMEIEPQRQQ